MRIKLLRIKQVNSVLYVIFFVLDFSQLILVFIDFGIYVSLLQIKDKLKGDRTFLGRGVGEFPENVPVQTEMLFADDNFFS